MRKKFLYVGAVVALSGCAPAIPQNDVTASKPLASIAATPSHIGEIAPRDIETYKGQMLAAMRITDFPRRDAAVTEARLQLARSTKRPLSAATISEIDSLYDLGSVSPQLGATG